MAAVFEGAAAALLAFGLEPRWRPPSAQLLDSVAKLQVAPVAFVAFQMGHESLVVVASFLALWDTYQRFARCSRLPRGNLDLAA